MTGALFVYLRIYINTYLHIYIFIFWYFNNSPYICSAKLITAIAVPSSTRIDAQYEIGLFLCPSVNHLVEILEMVPYTKL